MVVDGVDPVERIRYMRAIAVGLMLSICAPAAFADDANQLLERANTLLKSLARFGLLAFAVTGLFLAGTAFLEIHRLRQTQEPIGRPITKLLIGAALTSLSVLIGVISGTFGTASSQQAELNLS
jgi:uncharacterized membrane protein YfcA